MQPEPFIERFQRSRETECRTVGLGYDITVPSPILLLVVNELEMVVVDAGNDHWDIGLHAEGRRGADDRNCPSELRLQHFGLIRLDGGEDQVYPAGHRVGQLDRQGKHFLVGFLVGVPPAGAGLGVCDGIAVGPAGRSLRSGQCSDLEPGMVLQGHDELLADNACRADYTRTQQRRFSRVRFI